MKQLLLDIQPPAQLTFDNYVVGRNAEAVHSLRMALEGNPETRFIYLWGEAGSGKSHLLAACRAAAKVSTREVVCVDDVHQLSSGEQIRLFDTYNQLKESGGTLITAGVAAPSQMGLRDDLATRLAWGLAYQLQSLTDDEKARALRNHAKSRGMKLPDEVLDYCLRYLRRDMPTLIATIDALDEWSLASKRQVTLPLLRQILASTTQP
ncbi:MAG TPA: DnaA/Hda family protein [Methylophilaceae bacterium]|nr:DnaA/Hda family protein [Methylophilaceae bacterium]